MKLCKAINDNEEYIVIHQDDDVTIFLDFDKLNKEFYVGYGHAKDYNHYEGECKNKKLLACHQRYVNVLNRTVQRQSLTERQKLMSGVGLVCVSLNDLIKIYKSLRKKGGEADFINKEEEGIFIISHNDFSGYLIMDNGIASIAIFKKNSIYFKINSSITNDKLPKYYNYMSAVLEGIVISEIEDIEKKDVNPNDVFHVIPIWNSISQQNIDKFCRIDKFFKIEYNKFVESGGTESDIEKAIESANSYLDNAKKRDEEKAREEERIKALEEERLKALEEEKEIDELSTQKNDEEEINMDEDDERLSVFATPALDESLEDDEDDEDEEYEDEDFDDEDDDEDEE